MEDRIREFDGVTYKDLFLSSIDVVYIRRLDIVQKPGSHASLYLEAVLDGEQEENELQNISKTMTLMYRTEGETRPLFYGVIDKIFIRKDGEDVSLYLEAWDATYLMDTERRRSEDPDFPESADDAGGTDGGSYVHLSGGGLQTECSEDADRSAYHPV